MRQLLKRSLYLVVACVIGGLAIPSVQAGKSAPKTEEQVIAQLASPNEDVVAEAMLTIEKNFPNSAQGVAEIKKYLTDKRPKVRRKAARVLGSLHATMSPEELKQVGELLNSQDYREIMDGLIAMRGLKAQDLLPEIRKKLNYPHPNVVRDACRTLAVLGSKEDIALLEPLTKSENPAVQQDAKDAIFKLEAK